MVHYPLSATTQRFAHWLEDALTEAIPAVGTSDNDPHLWSSSQTRGQLRRLLVGRPGMPAAFLHLVGLDALRETLGERWKRVADRVRTLTEHLIAGATRPNDFWFRYGEEHYVILFADLSHDAARLACATLVEQLHVMLLGEPDLSRISFDTMVVDCGLADIEHTVLADLRNVAVRTGGAVVTGDPPPKPTASAHPPPRLPEPDWGPLGSSGFSGSGLAELYRSEMAPDLSDAQLRYMPVWDVRNQAITTYLVSPIREGDTGWNEDGASILHGKPQPEALAILDHFVLREAVVVLDELYRNKFRMYVTVPVHFDTLSQVRRRINYLQTFQNVSGTTQKQLIFSLHGIPAGVPVSRLAEIVSALKPHCRSVIAHTDLLNMDPALFAGSGLSMVGAELPMVLQKSGRTQEIQKITAHLHRLQIRLYLGNVRRAETALALEAVGVDFLYGAGIAPVREFPEHMLRLTDADVRARVSSGAAR
jgi:hypothetical protein